MLCGAGCAVEQDLLDRAPGELNSGCDSSDCLICQGQRQFCNQAITNTLLGARRASSSTAGTPACSSQLSTVTAPQQSASQQQPQQRRSAQPEEDDQRGQRKRLRVSAALTRVGSTGEAASTATAVDSLPSSSQVEQQLQQEQPHQQHAQQQDLPAPLCSSGSQILQHSSSASWQWQPEFAALDGPAPARFVQAARLQPPADALPGHCPGRCDRISGLEFSPDGQLVAAAGVSKEVSADSNRSPVNTTEQPSAMTMLYAAAHKEGSMRAPVSPLTCWRHWHSLLSSC